MRSTCSWSRSRTHFTSESADADDPKVQNTIAQLGNRKRLENDATAAVVIEQLGSRTSDLAFQPVINYLGKFL